MGALWAGRVFYHLGETLPGGATTAPAAAQVVGLHDTFVTAGILIAIALGLSIWGLVKERRSRQVVASMATPKPTD
jgi:hypothetical protein